jgi:hypothetical protein
MWDPQHLTTLWASTACYGDSFTLLFCCSSDISRAVNEGNAEEMETVKYAYAILEH